MLNESELETLGDIVNVERMIKNWDLKLWIGFMK